MGWEGFSEEVGSPKQAPEMAVLHAQSVSSGASPDLIKRFRVKGNYDQNLPLCGTPRKYMLSLKVTQRFHPGSYTVLSIPYFLTGF